MDSTNVTWTLTVEAVDEAARALPLVERRYVVGRGEGCDVRLDEQNVSRRHATIGRDEAGGWWVEDGADGKPSYNGTYVNGQLVCGRVALSSGMVVQVGDVILSLRSGDGALASGGGFLPGRSAVPIDQLPDRLVIVEGPQTGQLLRLDRGPVTIGGHPSCSLRLLEPGCEDIAVIVRPLVGGDFEMVRHSGPVKVYVSIHSYERRLLWNNDFLLLEHADGRMLCEARFRARSKGEAKLPGTPIPVGADGASLPPSWEHWLLPPSEARGEAVPEQADPTPVPENDVAPQTFAPHVGREAALRVSNEAGQSAPQVDETQPLQPLVEPLVSMPEEARDAPPPRSWRRVAWSAVASAAALGVVASVWGRTWPTVEMPAASTSAQVARAEAPAIGSASEVARADVVPTPPEHPIAPASSSGQAGDEGTAGARMSRVARPRASKADIVPARVERNSERGSEDAERARLEARAKSGTANARELQLLRALCSAQQDTACQDRATKWLQQKKVREEGLEF
jgi:FHA domain